jgi:hypothetical protein
MQTCVIHVRKHELPTLICTQLQDKISEQASTYTFKAHILAGTASKKSTITSLGIQIHDYKITNAH